MEVFFRRLNNFSNSSAQIAASSPTEMSPPLTKPTPPSFAPTSHPALPTSTPPGYSDGSPPLLQPTELEKIIPPPVLSPTGTGIRWRDRWSSEEEEKKMSGREREEEEIFFF
jgi:hypothetical protein